MKLKPIRNPADHEAALGRIELLMDAEAGTPEGDELDVLVTLVESWEQKHFPIEAPDPIEFIKNVMEFKGESQASLARILRSRPRASEILARKRKLTLAQIRTIAAAWNIPVEPLVGEYELVA